MSFAQAHVTCNGSLDQTAHTTLTVTLAPALKLLQAFYNYIFPKPSSLASRFPSRAPLRSGFQLTQPRYGANPPTESGKHQPRNGIMSRSEHRTQMSTRPKTWGTKGQALITQGFSQRSNCSLCASTNSLTFNHVELQYAMQHAGGQKERSKHVQ